MTTFVLSPANTDVKVRKASEMFAAGELKAFTRRSNGTLRRVDLLVEGSTKRETAEGIAAKLTEGSTVKSVARELHASVATVRRYLTALELTKEIEAGEHDSVFTATAPSYSLPQTEALAAIDEHGEAKVAKMNNYTEGVVNKRTVDSLVRKGVLEYTEEGTVRRPAKRDVVAAK